MIEQCFKIEVAVDARHFDMFRDIFARAGSSSQSISDVADKLFATGIKTRWGKMQRRKKR